MDAEAVVTALFRAHLGLEDTNTIHDMRSFRDLFRVQALALQTEKLRLLVAAERTGCSAVIMDVLLFLSQTMSTHTLQRALTTAPIAKQQWTQYELAENARDAMDESVAIALEARVASVVAFLVATKAKQVDIATVLLGMVFVDQHTQSLDSSLAVAKEVARVTKRTRPFKLPVWAMALLDEFIALTELQLHTEHHDAFLAPPLKTMSGYFDKRARGASHVNANWRMRFFQLAATEILYSKHDAEKISNSRNPFLDKRTRGVVALHSGMRVEPLNYTGKLSRRPYCVQIGTGDEALILDALTPVVQTQWIEAVAGNCRRLALDTRWTRFPRSCVHRMSLHAFFLYALLYHHDKPESADTHPLQLASTFSVDEKRVLFATLLTLARVGDWQQFELLVSQKSKSKSFLPLSTGSVTPSIGYGPMLDLAHQFRAPPSMIAKIDALYAKQDARKPAWRYESKEMRHDTT